MTTLLSGAFIGSFAVPAMAQDAGNDEIVVTGSRIKKKDFTSNAPVATVEAAQFERTGSVNTENLLNTLPQTVPGLDRTSNNPGNGSATVNLRGLGSNRTLVLVNGQRAVPFSSAGVVDLNTIPIALISSVEVLTGGASSVYGADAVAGVVNFIYNDSFEGLEANLGYQMTEQGDAGLFNASVTMGANLDGGRGNVALNVSYANRESLLQGDREFSQTALFDDGNGGLIPGGSSGVPGTRSFNGYTFPDGTVATGTFNPDGSIRPFVTAGAVNDFYNYAPVNFLQLPQERIASTALARYEINEHAEVYGRFSFSTNEVDSELAPTPIFQSSTFSLDGNPFLPAATQRIISAGAGDGVDTDGDGIDDTATSFFGRRLVEVGNRQSVDTNQSLQAVFGIRGETWIDGWDYDVSMSEGRTLRSQQQNGNVNRSRYDAGLLLADADGDGNVDLDANGNATCAADPGGSTVACTPMNIFGAGNISEQSAAYLRTAANARATFDQTVVQANFSGDLGGFEVFNAGSIGAAFGFEYIENQFDFSPSQDIAASTIAGFNGSPAVNGKYDVYSAYGELSVPLVRDMPFAQSITLDLAGRLSDYSTTGKSNTYKIGGDWAVNDQIRFRGNYNTAVRAPNIGELFSPQGENFPGGSDPCAAEGNPNAATTAICIATGVPASVVGSPNINAISGQVRTLTGGNPNLQNEEAETFTVGAVFTPTFVSGLTLSVDYYDIKIQDAIAEFGGGTNNVLSTCYTDPAGGVGSAFCNAITRRGNGSIDNVSLLSQNVAEITTKGIDVAANYSMETADVFGNDFGALRFTYLGTFVEENDFVAFDGADPIECAGNFGVDCGTPDPSYRHRLTTIWDTDRFSTQLAWRLVGEVDDDDPSAINTVESIDTTHYFDGSTTFDVSDNLAFTFGINNIFDESPPVIGDNDQQANTYPNQYDVFGRTYFLNAKTRF
ncbi:TonB-dependent receptor domain-containing protein [Robiginitomaculum antarcticum]|uniref:TonB-dependent receptor domain-containing protein n=1 Tax=Robiginitomaculum antarcticum TaxID=437507 RepID=UPI00037BEABC|nr:TonB-dependent receptor [Robiginitomaculum antarcticum]